MPDEKDSSAELDARPLDREAARELYRSIRARIVEEAHRGIAQGEAKRKELTADEEPARAEWKRELEEKEARRLAQLRLQARMMLAEEKTTEETE